LYLDEGQNLNFAMPVNYLKSLKQSNIKLSSLPKMPQKSTNANYSLVELFEKKDSYVDNKVVSEFVLKNIYDYPIKNIKIIFIYKNYKGDVVSYSLKEIKKIIFPKLALQFEYDHTVKNYEGFVDNEGYFYEYSLRFYNEDLDWAVSKGMKHVTGTVEIRVLDYEIDSSSSLRGAY